MLFFKPFFFAEQLAEAKRHRKGQRTADRCVDHDRHNVCTDEFDIKCCHRSEDNDLK